MPENSGVMFRTDKSLMYRMSVFLLVFASCSGIVLVGSDSNVELNLSNGTASDGIWVTDSQVTLLPLTETLVTITNVSMSGFSVIHVHSFPPKSNISVKHNVTTIYGSDVGLVYAFGLGPTVFTLSNPLPWTVEVLIVIRTYNDSYSVPGGCALEFPNKIAPYVMVEQGNETIAVKGQKGAENINDQLCLNNDLEYEFYYSYTTDIVTKAQDHFTRLRYMLNYKDINDWAYKAYWMAGPPTQRVFAKYPGVCTYYAMAVRNRLGLVSLYSPSSSMLCSLEGSEYLSISAKALLALLIPIGAILCFAGHSVLPFSIFVITSLAGYQLSYVSLTDTGLAQQEAIAWGFFVAMCIAAVVIFILLACTFPILWLAIPAGAGAYLFYVALYFIYAGNLSQFTSGPTYWGVLIGVTLLIAGILIFIPSYGCIASLVLIGGYLISYVISQIVGTRLHYVTINTIRRLTVEGFDTAVTSVPLNTADIIMLGVWLTLAISGFEKQRRRAQGRAPFPPLPRLFSQPPEENSPLLRSFSSPSGYDW